MDRIRTLLLARTATVVMDPDRVARAVTRPSRDADFERFEDELLQLGYVLSLDLAMTVRRLPHQAIQELKAWIMETLTGVTPQRPIVPSAEAGKSAYQRHVLAWLATRPEQPCPWCGEVKLVGALDPCGHLVCKTCWDAGVFAGCPVCHRRTAPAAPFAGPVACERVQRHGGELRLVHLAFDVVGVARARFERLLASTKPVTAADRAELELVIDVIGPGAAKWLPARIPVKETMAYAVARLWLVAPERLAMITATQAHVRTATDVLRVAAVLMGANPELAEPMRLRSISRALRRAVLEALAQLPPGTLVDDMMRHQSLWKRAGERLHPGELEAKLPIVARAFAVVRGGARAAKWAAPVEDLLRTGDARAASERLLARPDELLARADHLLRLDPSVLGVVERAIEHGSPARLLVLRAHVLARGEPWPRRVFFGSNAARAWIGQDQRPVLAAGVREAIGELVDRELLARAEALRPFARAVIDRELADLLVPYPQIRVARFAALVRSARPSVWDVACIHAAARANVIYVRELGGVTMFQRREGETALARLARLRAGEHDGVRHKIPPANAPTWLAIARDDLEIPPGSCGFVRTGGAGVERSRRGVLVAELVKSL